MTALAVVALVPAAGFGTRFHDSGPKALVKLAGKPFVLRSIERLAASGLVQRAVVAAPEEHLDAFRTALASSPIPVVVVGGGVSRKDSVANAFRATTVGDDDLVCVHDAARPLVDPDEVRAVIEAAKENGAALAVSAMSDTVKRVDAGRVTETVPRSDLVGAGTPQVFRASIFRAALEREGHRDVTDDAELVERAGFPVTVVLTSRWNLKITYPEDLAWAEAYLARHG